MAAKPSESNQDLLAIPKICQYKNLGSSKNEKILNENPDWLKDQGPIPFWSRLKSSGCTEQLEESSKMQENNFIVEIPGRLLSLFGSVSSQTDCLQAMEGMKNMHLMSNVFALCAVLKHDISAWSENLIDQITTAAVAQYADFLKGRCLTDQEVNINHFNGLFHFRGDDYKAQIHQVARGVLYINFGLNQLNLARALSWFFQRYQFGFLSCGQRILAIARVLNKQFDYFMYDCQSRDYPMFAKRQSTSYILSTPYLQILHYCLLKTLNFSEKINFTLYNSDITIIHASEAKAPKPTANQFMAKNSGRNLRKNKATSGNGTTKVQKVMPKKVQKNLTNILQTSAPKRDHKLKVQNCPIIPKSETSSVQAKNRKIILDPSNMYYIVAVPKARLVTAKIEPKLLIIPKDGQTSTANNHGSHQVRKAQTNDFEVERLLDSINLGKSASTVTLTPETLEANVIQNPENLGLKVYLVANNDGQDLTDPNSVHKIKIAHQLMDFFIK